jgi:hypothetical protein
MMHSVSAAMGASNFTYAEASWTQALADWIGAIPDPSQRSAAYPSVMGSRKDDVQADPTVESGKADTDG